LTRDEVLRFAEELVDPPAPLARPILGGVPADTAA
jgi:hypothetical protein